MALTLDNIDLHNYIHEELSPGVSRVTLRELVEELGLKWDGTRPGYRFRAKLRKLKQGLAKDVCGGSRTWVWTRIEEIEEIRYILQREFADELSTRVREN